MGFSCCAGDKTAHGERNGFLFTWGCKSVSAYHHYNSNDLRENSEKGWRIDPRVKDLQELKNTQTHLWVCSCKAEAPTQEKGLCYCASCSEGAFVFELVESLDQLWWKQWEQRQQPTLHLCWLSPWPCGVQAQDTPLSLKCHHHPLLLCCTLAQLQQAEQAQLLSWAAKYPAIEVLTQKWWICSR